MLSSTCQCKEMLIMLEYKPCSWIKLVCVISLWLYAWNNVCKWISCRLKPSASAAYSNIQRCRTGEQALGFDLTSMVSRWRTSAGTECLWSELRSQSQLHNVGDKYLNTIQLTCTHTQFLSFSCLYYLNVFLFGLSCPHGKLVKTSSQSQKLHANWATLSSRIISFGFETTRNKFSAIGEHSRGQFSASLT